MRDFSWERWSVNDEFGNDLAKTTPNFVTRRDPSRKAVPAKNHTGTITNWTSGRFE